MELDLRQLLRPVRRWWWLLLLVPLIAATTAFAIISRQTPRYSATATLLINPSQSQDQQEFFGIQASQQLAATYQRLVVTEPVLQAVIDRLDLPLTSGELWQQVGAGAVVNTQLLEVSADDPDPGTAAAIANAVAEEFATYVGTQAATVAGTSREQLDRQITALEQQIADLSADIQELEQREDADQPIVQSQLATLRGSVSQLQYSYGELMLRRQEMELNESALRNRITVWERAQVPDVPYAPRPKLYTLFALALGLLVAAGAVLLLEYLDNTVKPDTDLAALVQAPLLSSVPQVPNVKPGLSQLFVLDQPTSGASESIRLLRTNLQFAAATQPISILAIASPGPGEGKSTLTANLAIAMAQGNHSVIVIDADLRRPTQHRIFDVRNEIGLTTLLTHGEMPWREAAANGPVDGLLVIPSGPIPPNPTDLLDLDRFALLLAEMSKDADIVLIDTSPVLAVSDPLVVGRKADGVLLVCHIGRTRRDALSRAAGLLRQGGLRLVGVVLNQETARLGAGYYYGYYGPEDKAGPPPDLNPGHIKPGTAT